MEVQNVAADAEQPPGGAEEEFFPAAEHVNRKWKRDSLPLFPQLQLPCAADGVPRDLAPIEGAQRDKEVGGLEALLHGRGD